MVSIQVGGNIYFYPRSPCGERRTKKLSIPVPAYFYPRSPCGERLMHALKLANTMLFLSTLSLRRATNRMLLIKFFPGTFLSTLSLRRATRLFLIVRHLFNNFYPRSPCGERRLTPRSPCKMLNYFYPRSPCGERQPPPQCPRFITNLISIHALLAESDHCSSDFAGRPDISIHALLAESDAFDASKSADISLFLSTLSLRRATSNGGAHYSYL